MKSPTIGELAEKITDLVVDRMLERHELEISESRMWQAGWEAAHDSYGVGNGRKAFMYRGLTPQQLNTAIRHYETTTGKRAYEI